MSMSTLTVASVPRSMDIAQINQNEHNKAVLEQNALQSNLQKNINNKSENVVARENAQLKNQNYDAKEKGQNEYEYVKRKKKKEEEKDGQVVLKGTSSFDIKV